MIDSIVSTEKNWGFCYAKIVALLCILLGWWYRKRLKGKKRRNMQLLSKKNSFAEAFDLMTVENSHHLQHFVRHSEAMSFWKFQETCQVLNENHRKSSKHQLGTTEASSYNFILTSWRYHSKYLKHT